MLLLQIPETVTESRKFILLNMRVRAIRTAPMDVHLQNNSPAKIKPRDKVTHFSMQLRAAVIGISGSLNCALTFREIAENTSPQTRISLAAPASSKFLVSQALRIHLIQELVLLHWTRGVSSS